MIWTRRRGFSKTRSVNFRVLNGQVVPPEKKVEAAAAKKQQRKKALVGIEIRKLNHFSNKPFANGFCALEYSKLKMGKTCQLLTRH